MEPHGLALWEARLEVELCHRALALLRLQLSSAQEDVDDLQACCLPLTSKKSSAAPNDAQASKIKGMIARAGCPQSLCPPFLQASSAALRAEYEGQVASHLSTCGALEKALAAHGAAAAEAARLQQLKDQLHATEAQLKVSGEEGRQPHRASTRL